MKLVRLAVATLVLSVLTACGSSVTGPSQPSAPTADQGTYGSGG